MNKFSNRPIAPHLTIYSLQGSSLFSIWHRISAVLLVSFVITSFFTQKFFLWTSYSFVIHNVLYFSYQLTNSYVVFFLYSLVLYHITNGVRHILWDLGFFLTNKTVTKTNAGIISTFFVLQSLLHKNILL